MVSTKRESTMAEIPPDPRLPLPPMLSVAAVVKSLGILPVVPVAEVSGVAPGGWVIRVSAVVTGFDVALVAVVGASVVGVFVVGTSVVGISVVGASVVGASVIGVSVVGASVVGASVVGVSVVGASVVGVSVDGGGCVWKIHPHVPTYCFSHLTWHTHEVLNWISL